VSPLTPSLRSGDWSTIIPAVTVRRSGVQRSDHGRHEGVAATMSSVAENLQLIGGPLLGQPPSRDQWSTHIEPSMDDHARDRSEPMRPRCSDRLDRVSNLQRYYFHIRHAKVTVLDHAGFELASVRGATMEAAHRAREMASVMSRITFRQQSGNHRCSDETWLPVFEIPIEELKLTASSQARSPARAVRQPLADGVGLLVTRRVPAAKLARHGCP